MSVGNFLIEGPGGIFQILANQGYRSNLPVIAPLQDSGGQNYNVKAAGAKGDGVTNDTAAIQAAIAAAGNSQGGNIFFPPGKYMVSSPLLCNTDALMLQGAGAPDMLHPLNTASDVGAGTIIAPLNNFPSGQPLIHNNSTEASFGGTSVTQTRGFAVRDMRLFCQAGGVQAGASLAAGIQSNGPEHWQIMNVEVENANGIGINVRAVGPSGDNGVILNCTVQDSPGFAGIYCSNWESSVIGNQVLHAQGGITLDNAVSAFGNTVDSDTGNAFTAGTGTSFINNYVFGYCNLAGMLIKGDRVRAIGNFIDNCGAGNPGDETGAAFDVAFNAKIITISGNVVRAGTGTTYWVYHHDNISSLMNVTGNTFSGTPTIAKTFDAQTVPDAQYHGNIGIPDSKISFAASTTNFSHMNLAPGTAPTSPNDGDIWYDGTNIKIRVGGTTKTFTIT